MSRSIPSFELSHMNVTCSAHFNSVRPTSEAEEAMLVQSVQEALARISAHRTPTLRSSTGVSVQRTVQVA